MSSVKKLLSVFFAVVFFFPAVVHAFLGEEKILDRDLLLFTKSGEKQKVIVVLKGSSQIAKSFSEDQDEERRIKRDIKRQLDMFLFQSKSYDGSFNLRTRLNNLPIFSAEIGGDMLAELAGSDEVVSIEKIEYLTMSTRQGIALMNPGKYESVRRRAGGKGVSVAVIDTGVNYGHPLLGNGVFPNSKIIGGYDFVKKVNDPVDIQGHGTACISIVGGVGENGDYAGGVAPEAKIYALQVFKFYETIYGRRMGAADDQVAAAMDWILDHRNDDPENPIKIVSMSLGGSLKNAAGDGFFARTDCGKNTPKYTLLLQKLRNAGITVFAASGNEYQENGIATPACIGDAVAVGAVFDADIRGFAYKNQKTGEKYFEDVKRDTVTRYSNSAPTLELLGPSNNAKVPQGSGSGYYPTMGGTSAATPYVAGVAALIQSRYHDHTDNYLSPAQIIDILKKNGDSIYDNKSKITTPRVNIERSLTAVDVLVQKLRIEPEPEPQPEPPQEAESGSDRIRNKLKGKLRIN